MFTKVIERCIYRTKQLLGIVCILPRCIVNMEPEIKCYSAP